MKLSQIFPNKDLSPEEKIAAIAKVVTKARADYGNEDAEISVGQMHTTEGMQDLAMLSDESKLAIAESEVGNIKRVATEFCKTYEGAKLDRKIAELIAISPILANITDTVDSDYL